MTVWVVCVGAGKVVVLESIMLRSPLPVTLGATTNAAADNEPQLFTTAWRERHGAALQVRRY